MHQKGKDYDNSPQFYMKHLPTRYDNITCPLQSIIASSKKRNTRLIDLIRTQLTSELETKTGDSNRVVGLMPAGMVNRVSLVFNIGALNPALSASLPLQFLLDPKSFSDGASDICSVTLSSDNILGSALGLGRPQSPINETFSSIPAYTKIKHVHVNAVK